jgi:hypothetical protein
MNNYIQKLSSCQDILENKYFKYYTNIIENASKREISGYTERHHILPKSLGGDNDKNNIVALTAREHFICHHLLSKFTTGRAKSKMSYALWRLSNKKDGRIKSSKIYDQVRKNHANMLSKSKTGVKRKSFSDEARRNMSEAKKGKPSNRKGMKQPPEAVEAMRQKLIGRKKDIEKEYPPVRRRELAKHFRKINKDKPKKKSPCMYCEMEVAPHIMARFHGEKCKFKPE